MMEVYYERNTVEREGQLEEEKRNKESEQT